MPKKPVVKSPRDDKKQTLETESPKEKPVRDSENKSLGVSKKDKRKIKRQKLIQSTWRFMIFFSPLDLAKTVQQKTDSKQPTKKNDILTNLSTIKDMLPSITESNITNYKAEKLTMKKKQNLA
jgi:hypothetical protein